MSKYPSSITHYVTMHLQRHGVPYNPQLSRQENVDQFASQDVAALIDEAFAFAYEAKYKNDAFQPQLQSLLKITGMINPQRAVTNEGPAMMYLFDRAKVNKMDVTYIGSAQRGQEFLNEIEGIITPLTGTEHLKSNSQDLCLDLNEDMPLAEREQEVNEFIRVLKPGGVALIVTTAIDDVVDPDVNRAIVIENMLKERKITAISASFRRMPNLEFVLGVK